MNSQPSSSNPVNTDADVVVVGATPAGIAAALAAARHGKSVILLERSAHPGGLPANGLGATDIKTRGTVGGLFLEFTRLIRRHYEETYGPESEQLQLCSDGYRFEPSVAEDVLCGMLREAPLVSLRTMRQFDSSPENLAIENGAIVTIRVLNRETGAVESYRAKRFIDATYEGDLAAAAGVPYRLGREGVEEHGEPMAGRFYAVWFGEEGSGALFERRESWKTSHNTRPRTEAGSTGQADNAIQAYNYRMCLTCEEGDRVEISRPADYRREEYASLVDDVRSGFLKAFLHTHFWCDAGVVNPTSLPNGKTDSNNHHSALLSTDLAEENWPWPTSGWAWRDRFAQRLRDYTLGLIWFCQHDPELPAAFREAARAWGLSKSEYADNGHFPRQVYVREGRRMEGTFLFTAHDAIPTSPGGRPPVHAESITSAHYDIDSHAVRKREPGHAALDGFLSHATQPYTVPYGTTVPRKVSNLLFPVAVSATHLGFGTLRMEPCWMGLGEAAGTAAALSLDRGISVQDVPVVELQQALLAQGAVIFYVRDLPANHPHAAAVQMLGLRGAFIDWECQPDAPSDPATFSGWLSRLGLSPQTCAFQEGESRAVAMQRIYEVWLRQLS
jgi:hypothetical protein